MRVCFDCKVALYNGAHCPYCGGHLYSYNRDYILDIVYTDPEWTVAVHEGDLRQS